jgi:hypothetical protein
VIVAIYVYRVIDLCWIFAEIGFAILYMMLLGCAFSNKLLCKSRKLSVVVFIIFVSGKTYNKIILYHLFAKQI